MLKSLFLTTLFLFFVNTACGAAKNYTQYTALETSECEPLDIDFCTSGDNPVPYKLTRFPNLLHHGSQREAAQELQQFLPLERIRCSKDLKFFLCSLYAPICTGYRDVLPPCRSLCRSARHGCENLMRKFGFDWPEMLDCEDEKRFPNDGNNNPLCIYVNNSLTNRDRDRTRADQTDHRPASQDISFRCPPNLVSLNADHVWHLGSERLEKCGLPCENIFFPSPSQQHFLRYWIAAWSLCCIVCTLLAIGTVLANLESCVYPQFPIVFLASCYLMIAATYCAGALWGEKSIPCDRPQSPDRPLLIAMGSKNTSCVVTALVIYFFTLAAHCWWVVLTYCWLLAAKFKWSSEAISSQAQYFHLVAWSLPALLSILVILSKRIDGEVHAGVCSVGNWDAFSASVFVTAPSAVCFIVGLILFTISFASLRRIRAYFSEKQGQIVRLQGTQAEPQGRTTATQPFLFHATPTPDPTSLYRHMHPMSVANADGESSLGSMGRGGGAGPAVYMMQTYVPQQGAFYSSAAPPHSAAQRHVDSDYASADIAFNSGVNCQQPVDAAKAECLSRLLVKITSFFILYNVPSALVICCNLYQSMALNDWINTWFTLACTNDELGSDLGLTTAATRSRVCLGADIAFDTKKQPEFFVFLIKYAMTLSIGIACASWMCKPRKMYQFVKKIFTCYCLNAPLKKQQQQTRQQQQGH